MCERITMARSDYKTNGKVVYLIQYHIVWCPKFRRNLFTGALKDRLETIIRECCLERNVAINALEVMPNHVHLFVSCDYKSPVYKLIKAIKGRSSHNLREEFPDLKKMHTLWSRSFFVASIGNVSTSTVQKYIENQWN